MLGKASHTQSHLLGDQGRDGDLGGRISRFPLLIRPERPLNPAALSSDIAGSRPTSRFVVDSSFFDHRLDDRIWHALISRRDDIVVLPQVRTELVSWLAKHESHFAAQALTDGAFKEAIASGLDDPELKLALRYYVWLLGLRKRLYRLATITREAELGRSLNAQEIKQAKQSVLQDYGARGVLLARKGANPVPSHTSMRTDEILTATAFAAAIVDARPTVILTRDEDIFDQSYKLQWLLDTQYRGLLFADAYLAEPDGFSTLEMPHEAPWTHAFRPHDGLLIHRSEQMLDAILPNEFRPVPIECWLVRDGESRLAFAAETGMLRLLRVKAATGGLNTDRLAGRNSHIWLAPLQVPRDLRDCVAIAHDHRIPLREDSLAAPSLEINQTLMTIERFRRPDWPSA